ncbi:Ig-like domain-containing protein, partial [Xanthobacter autotrophicus]|uniref:Ig-like domain-containing protein n=1 Tax=Xanthobacter autotrophicus TaxID=280 RepID=UPI00372C9A23
GIPEHGPLLSPTGTGSLPDDISDIGGIVLDLVGINGTRVVAQLPADSLYKGYAAGPLTVIGTQSGFTSEVISSLGGGIAKASVRVTLDDGDSAAGNFDIEDNQLFVNGTAFGDFSHVTTQITSADGQTDGSVQSGFPSGGLATGWFSISDPAQLEQFYQSLSSGSVTYALADEDPGDNFLDFTQGLDTSIVNAGTPPKPVNSAPVATADAFSAFHGFTLAGQVLSNDSDGDGDTLTASLVDGVGHGTLDFRTDGTFTYTPQADFIGTDRFTYRVSDGITSSNITTVTLTVAANSAPVATDDAYQLEGGDAFAVPASHGVLANDTDHQGQLLFSALVAAPQHGSLALNSNGSFSYTPDDGYLGTDSFTYVVTDGALSDMATVTLTVVPKPVSLDLPSSLAPGETGTATLTYNGTEGGTGIGLILVEAEGALIADPVTGALNDSVLVLASVNSTTALGVKMASSQTSASLTASVADAAQVIDWVSQSDLLRPDGVSDDAWARAFTNFQLASGATAGSVTAELSESAARLSSFGMGGNSASTALAFELGQALDFGSLAAREEEGSLGTGWAFIGDVRLEIDAEGDAVLKGLASFDALSALDARAVGAYTLSNSVGRAVDLSGGLGGALPTNVMFARDITGSYSGGTALGATLTKTQDGYALTEKGGRVLTFDAEGKLIGLTDALGRQTLASYDADGNIIGFTGPDGRALTISRDAAGTVTAISDADGNAVTLAYDGYGNLVSSTTAAGSAAFTYDTDGYLASSATSGNPTLSFAYDANGRLASISAGDGGGSESYTYDEAGGYTITDAAGRSITVELLPDGSVGRVSDANGQSSSLLFDANGNLTAVVGPDGTQTQLGFDDQSRLVSVTDGNGATLQ